MNFLADSFGQKVANFVREYLSMNVWTLVVHVVCAVVIILCIVFWLWKPTEQFISKHRELLNKERKELLVNNRETKYFLGLLKKERNEVFNTRRAIMTTAQKEAEEIRTSAIAYMDKQNADLKKAYKNKIIALEERAQENIKEIIVKEALGLTEKLIGANLNEENNKKVIEAYLKSLEEREPGWSAK